MGEKSDQIERHIQAQRNELSDNIAELQEKVKDAFNWRVQFEQRPITMMGIALGGGLLLSSFMRSSSRSRNAKKSVDQKRSSGDQRAGRADSGTKASTANNEKSSEFGRNIKGALAGVVAARFGSILDSIIPGLNERHGKTRLGNSSFREQL